MPNVLSYDSMGRRPAANVWLVECIFLAIAQFPWWMVTLFIFEIQVSTKQVALVRDSLSYGFIALTSIISTIASGFALFLAYKDNCNFRTKFVLLVCFVVSVSMIILITLKWYEDVYCRQGQAWAHSFLP